jgi:hypothetical protein
MKTILHLVFLAILSFILIRTSAQVEDINSGNNSDPVLINGRLYVFHPPYGTGGDQFFSGREFSDGTVMVRGLAYSGLKLNYDIYNQQVILKYDSNKGAVNQIIMSDGWLESFTLGGLAFQLINTGTGKKEIYQVIGDDNIRVLYSWRKKLELSQMHGATNHVFSRQIKTMYLYLNDRMYHYSNNKSFLLLFDQGRRAEIRYYMRRNRVNVRKADDSSIAALLSFCNSL